MGASTGPVAFTTRTRSSPGSLFPARTCRTASLPALASPLARSSTGIDVTGTYPELAGFAEAEALVRLAITVGDTAPEPVAARLPAVLTIAGYSINDTIVVFDRIRENINKRPTERYETVVNRSILEVIHRSLATQLNAMFVMVAILLFGGASIKPFIAVLFVGLLSGTYSSIFTAVPLLVAWEKRELPGLT